MEHSVEKKYGQMVREYRRFAKICTNSGKEVSNTEARDKAEEFFNQCYHLKDYIKKDSVLSQSTDVEAYINDSEYLSLAADYCNTFKHGGLDRESRSGKSIERINTHIVLFQPANNGFNNFSRIEIKIDGKSYDAFDIATECLKEWNHFLRTNGLGQIIQTA